MRWRGSDCSDRRQRSLTGGSARKIEMKDFRGMEDFHEAENFRGTEDFHEMVNFCGTEGIMSNARIWEETVMIPTYPVGKPEKNPMFIEKRVYQGSSGRIYPYPTIESIGDEKKEQPYRAVFLENEYLKVMVLPELGGRIQRAYDKTNGYDFVYYNHVLKPALVGLLGPWVSGGIEFNWPQHHRPTTYMAVDHVITENADGSVSCLCSDVDRIYGTKGICKISLYPGISYIEICGQLYNRTPLPQTFLWWANPAVAVNDNTQTVMPPDVTAVMDHGKRDVSRFPIATGTYYKKDYSEGVDISRYKNIPVPTSFMAAESHYDFVGGYDNGVEAGILHVADHHVSPGKKQWTWGCGDFGKAWDRNLTDEDGPYVELMTGVFTDNQPDFTWLKPYEEKVFTQYFLPYKKVGMVRNATKEACIGCETEGKRLTVRVYATAVHENARITVKQGGETVFSAETGLSPVDIFEETIALTRELSAPEELDLAVTDGTRTLVRYRPDPEKLPELPDPAKEAAPPAEIRTNEELFLTGLHLEQYRHATYQPDDYYLEGLKRDPSDARINLAYGRLLLRRGRPESAEEYFRRAIERLTWKNPNPYDSEAYCDLGLALYLQERYDEAYDAFYKATWSAEQQNLAFYYLACIAMRQGRPEDALERIERSLVRNAHSVKARGLKAVILRKLGREEQAAALVRENLALDPFDYVSCCEALELQKGRDGNSCMDGRGGRDGSGCMDGRGCMDEEALRARSRGDVYNLLRAARDYAEAGCYEEACGILSGAPEHPLVHYYEGFYLTKLGREEEALAAVRKGEAGDPYCCFPNDPEDIAVLRNAIAEDPAAARAGYYLGCLYYDKQQWEMARNLWESSAAIEPSFPTVHRNLSLVYCNKCKDPQRALAALERAFALDPSDARIFMELDQLRSKTGMTFAERLARYEEYRGLVEQRDDLCVQYVTLLNVTGQPEKAYAFMMGRSFHPWEGGEGKITAQYEFSLLLLALREMHRGNAEEAMERLREALVYPHNLGEGKLEGTKDNHLYYYLGLLEKGQGDGAAAREAFEAASCGTDEPAGMMFYNDQPADMILYQGLAFRELGKKGSANRRFYRLIDYGERHIREEVKIGYFAVSLPDFLTFEDDLTIRNKAHCNFLMAMGEAGIGSREKARAFMAEAQRLDPSNARIALVSRILTETGIL